MPDYLTTGKQLVRNGSETDLQGEDVHLKAFAERISEFIEKSPKTQRQIAIEIGYSKSHYILAIKKGKMRVPLQKVPALARALDADPAALLRFALAEYNPALLAALTGVLGEFVTKNELELIRMLRRESGSEDIKYTEASAKAAVRASKTT